MDTGAGYSIVGGGPQFPKILGRPGWDNDHTVLLRAGKRAPSDFDAADPVLDAALRFLAER